MSFKLVVDGPDGPKVVHEIKDARVTRVSMSTREGGSGEVRVSPDQTEVVLSFELANPNEANLTDLDLIKYPGNLTEKDVKAKAKDLEKAGRPRTNEGRDFFTPEAIEEQKKLDEANQEETEDQRRGVYDPQRSADDREPHEVEEKDGAEFDLAGAGDKS